MMARRGVATWLGGVSLLLCLRSILLAWRPRVRLPEACKAASAHPGSTVPRRQPEASMEKDSLSRADQQYECVAEIGEGAYGKVFKAHDLKNGGRFLALKREHSQTSEEGMLLSTIHEVAVLRHLENSSTRSWSVEPGALAMGSRKVLGKGGWWPN